MACGVRSAASGGSACQAGLLSEAAWAGVSVTPASGGLAVVAGAGGEAGLGCECASRDWSLASLQRDEGALTDGAVTRGPWPPPPATLAPPVVSECARLLPATRPVPLLGTPSPQLPVGGSFSSRRSRLGCHLGGTCSDSSARVTFAPRHSLDTSPAFIVVRTLVTVRSYLPCCYLLAPTGL